MKPDWILIANAASARLLQREAGEPLVALKSFEHAASRLHSSALGDDKAGKQKADKAFGGAAFPPRTDPVGSSRVDLQACKLEYSIVSPK